MYDCSLNSIFLRQVPSPLSFGYPTDVTTDLSQSRWYHRIWFTWRLHIWAILIVLVVGIALHCIALRVPRSWNLQVIPSSWQVVSHDIHAGLLRTTGFGLKPSPVILHSNILACSERLSNCCDTALQCLFPKHGSSAIQTSLQTYDRFVETPERLKA